MPLKSWAFRKSIPRSLHYESFEAFYKREFKRTISLLVHGGASPSEAEDAVSEAMVSAWVSWETIRDPTSWMHVVARRNWITARERQGYERRCTQRNPPAPHHEDQYPSEDEYIRGTIARLPDMQRQVMELHLADFSVGEIAQLLHARPATVRSNLRHARENLERELSQPTATGEYRSSS